MQAPRWRGSGSAPAHGASAHRRFLCHDAPGPRTDGPGRSGPGSILHVICAARLATVLPLRDIMHWRPGPCVVPAHGSAAGTSALKRRAAMAKRTVRKASTKPKTKKKAIDSYDHTDKKRVNNPPVGLVTPETDQDTGKKTYAYDPHLDPQLVWAGKAEHTSFEVPTVSLHVHERIDPRTIIEATRRNGVGSASGRSTRGPQQLSLFEQPEQNPPLREAIEFYKHEGLDQRVHIHDRPAHHAQVDRQQPGDQGRHEPRGDRRGHRQVRRSGDALRSAESGQVEGPRVGAVYGRGGSGGQADFGSDSRSPF